MMVELGNGVEVRLGGRVHRLDPRAVVEGDVNMVSHAHSDHVPSRFSGLPVVCSEMTRAAMTVRRKAVERCACDSVEMVDAGHAPGSVMFVLRGEETLLYTGDFCTRRKGHIPPAEAVECDTLITESTYGVPEYEFPDHQETVSAIRDWVGDALGQGVCAVLRSYPFGKAQELGFELRDTPVRLQPIIASYNRALAAHGMLLPCGEPDIRPGDPFVYITSGMGSERGIVDRLVSRGAKVATFSGWAAGRTFARGPRSAEAFPLSDHCDYNELLEFVRRCSPSRVYTLHGFAERFAKSVERELGICATPLVRGQKTLSSFA